MPSPRDGFFRVSDYAPGDWIICEGKRYRYAMVVGDKALFIHSADDFFLSAMDNRFYVTTDPRQVAHGQAGTYKRNGDHFVFTSYDGLELLLTLEELPEGIKPIFA